MDEKTMKIFMKDTVYNFDRLANIVDNNAYILTDCRSVVDNNAHVLQNVSKKLVKLSRRNKLITLSVALLVVHCYLQDKEITKLKKAVNNTVVFEEGETKGE